MIHGQNLLASHQDLYQINLDNMVGVIENQSQIIDNLNLNNNGIYVKYLIDQYDQQDIDEYTKFNNKIVYANNTYISKQKLFTESGSQINTFNQDSIYLTKKNLLQLKQIAPDYLKTTDNEALDIILISENSEIKPLVNYINTNSFEIINDFILINREIDSNIPLHEILIELEPNNFSKEKSKMLNNTNLTDINLLRIYDDFKLSYDSVYFALKTTIQWIFTYVIVYVVIALLHNQILYYKKHKEITVYFVNGYNKRLLFYLEFIYSSLASVLLVLLIKNVLFPHFKLSIILTTIVSILVIEILILLATLKRLRSEIIKSIKTHQ